MFVLRPGIAAADDCAHEHHLYQDVVCLARLLIGDVYLRMAHRACIGRGGLVSDDHKEYWRLVVEAGGAVCYIGYWAVASHAASIILN